MARFAADPAPTVIGQEVALDASRSTFPPGATASFTWSFGDGATGSGIMVRHRYTSEGSFEVALTVRDDLGHEHTSSREIAVRRDVILVAGAFHACALRAPDLDCWGYNPRGAVGLGAMAPSAVVRPAPIFVDPPARGVAAGGEETCAMLADDQLKCWGDATRGQLGTGRGSVPAPTGATFLGLSRTASVVAVGAEHACAILDDASLKCWGAGADGRLGFAVAVDVERPPDAPILRGVRAIAAGGAHSCAVGASGDVMCWGRNDHGQLGVAGGPSLVLPVAPAPFPVAASRVAAGASHTCALLVDGTVRCWGERSDGRLGYGAWREGDAALLAADLPGAIDFGGARRAKEIGAGARHTCAVLEDGALTCWGANEMGQLGTGDTSPRDAPPPEGVSLGGRRARHVALGAAFTCASLDDGTARCWGDPRTAGFASDAPVMQPPAAPLELTSRP